MSKLLTEVEKDLAAGHVLGNLTAEEDQQVRVFLQERPEFIKEIRALQVSFNLVPVALPKISPPLNLKSKILATYITESNRNKFQKQIESPRFFTWVQRIAWVACLVALLLAADNFWLRRQLRLALRNQGQQAEVEQPIAATLQLSASRLISLNGLGDSKAGGTLLFTPGQWEEEVFIAFQNLPPLPPNQVYRMWVSMANGDVFYCGEFNTDAQGSVFMQLTPDDDWPEGVDALDVYVTVEELSATPEPTNPRVLFGAIATL